MTSKADMLRRFEDVRANNAIEGIVLNAEEEALFLHMIRNDMDADERMRLVDQYLAEALTPALSVAAE